MVALPLGWKLAILACAAVIGVAVAVRVRRAHGVGLDEGLRAAPWLNLMAVVAVVDAVAAWLFTLRPGLLWSLPLGLQYYATALNWGLVLGSMGLLFSVVLTLAMCRSGSSLEHLATCSALPGTARAV